MFLVTDLTGKAPRMTMINDVKTVRDVVIGITGDSKAGDAILGVAGYMRFGDEFICQPHFKVNCVRETDALKQDCPSAHRRTRSHCRYT